jgi:hypothetical protein
MNITHHIFLIFTKKHGINVSPDGAEYLHQLFGTVELALDQIKESLNFIALEYLNQNGLLL